MGGWGSAGNQGPDPAWAARPIALIVRRGGENLRKAIFQAAGLGLCDPRSRNRDLGVPSHISVFWDQSSERGSIHAQ